MDRLVLSLTISEYGNEHHRRVLTVQARRARAFEHAQNIKKKIKGN